MCDEFEFEFEFGGLHACDKYKAYRLTLSWPPANPPISKSFQAYAPCREWQVSLTPLYDAKMLMTNAQAHLQLAKITGIFRPRDWSLLKALNVQGMYLPSRAVVMRYRLLTISEQRCGLQTALILLRVLICCLAQSSDSSLLWHAGT